MNNGYEGVVLEEYRPKYKRMSGYMGAIKRAGTLMEVTLLTGRVIVRQVASVNRERISFKSQNDLFGRVNVAPEMIMTVAGATKRVDTDFSPVSERVMVECQPTEFRDFTKVIGSIYMCGHVAAIELVTGHVISGTIVRFDKEYALIQGKDRTLPTFVSCRGIRSITSFKRY